MCFSRVVSELRYHSQSEEGAAADKGGHYSRLCKGKKPLFQKSYTNAKKTLLHSLWSTRPACIRLRRLEQEKRLDRIPAELRWFFLKKKLNS